MSYNAWLLLTDIGIIGFISALIISLAVVLGRREDRHAIPIVADSSAVIHEEFGRRAS